MYGIRQVGRFNVNYAGNAYEKGTRYSMIIIEEFEGNRFIPESRRVLYVKNGTGYVAPDLQTEDEVRSFLKYRNYEKLSFVKREVRYILE